MNMYIKCDVVNELNSQIIKKVMVPLPNSIKSFGDHARKNEDKRNADAS